MSRKVAQIAREIEASWENVNYAARPYLDAMFFLADIDDMYYMDEGRSIVNYFLANASTWRGETAKRIKVELKDLLAAHPRA